MPRYAKKRPYRRRRFPKRGRRSTLARSSNTRRRVTRVTQVRTQRPISSIQKVIYYNTFKCSPKLDSTTGNQQLWGFKILLNNPWPFVGSWNELATTQGSTLVPNDPITTLNATSGQPSSSTTAIPGVLTDGFAYEKYANGCIVGTKTTVNASAITNDTTDAPQLAYLVTRKHSNVNDLPASTNISDLKKYPYLQMRKLNGGLLNTKQIDARLTVTHSPKNFNNIKDYRDNPGLSFKTDGVEATEIGHTVGEKDFLSVYVVPALNDYTPAGSSVKSKATDFMLTLRHEATILWTEPKTSVGQNPENFAYPKPLYRNPNMYRAIMGAGVIGSMY
ncbi:MAG: putative capsid protein [Circoviridae sp.]|nr:MAG: putative capsid protein [Circoviridae sp.]